MKTHITLLIACLVFFAEKAVSQSETSYRAETFGSVSSGDNTPFWMQYHNWGMVPLDANNFYVRGGAFHEQKINKDWSFKAGLDIAGSSPHSYGSLWIQQLYGELNWRFVRLNIGSKEDYTSSLNPYLSSGDFSYSNNSRPMPEVKISVPEFLLIPKTKGNMYIKGDFAVGKYMDGNYMEDVAKPHGQSYEKDVLSHHKSIYFRFGNIEGKHKLQFTLGLDHQVQWGGTLYQKDKNAPGGYNIVKQPKGLDDFFRVMIAKEGSSKSTFGDNAYVAGSQVGSYTLKLDYKLKDKESISLYTQHFFDDGSGMVFENYKDMLLGVEYKSGKKQLLSGAVLEYIYTKQQTGPIHFNMMMDDEHDGIRNKGNGNDNYYNNLDYVQGRSYYGRTMGTPLFLSPEYNTDGSLVFKSSRIIAFHLGIEGYLHPTFKYNLLATTGRSWGTYYVPYKSVKDGVASLLNLTYTPPKMPDLDVKLSLGFNTGKYFGRDTFGAGITIVKKGIICKK
ncbi:hypothetical protein M2132_001562 [Dysgonomonas sp. PH5-45]|uniref:capsule assembly Wzi family protein n=1 Tax=unclassified Dysgonomonas TaxID=2630389 RepID=UPI0024768D5A|nr:MULTISPECIES: capsule assembly Wzi family protein [unclassified Dysgonomonas]MDH6355224.1 hypothetical protein [Dysgonomonas sp. PH5-45]MDH6388153.1 hypothetical protein [Dysgonomonas sp. PH5-37]